MRSRPLAIAVHTCPPPPSPQVADTHASLWIYESNREMFESGWVLLGPPVVIRYRRETIRVPVSSLGANITANVSRCPCYVLHFVSRWKGMIQRDAIDRFELFYFFPRGEREVCDESWWQRCGRDNVIYRSVYSAVLKIYFDIFFKKWRMEVVICKKKYLRELLAILVEPRTNEEYVSVFLSSVPSRLNRGAQVQNPKA